MVIISINLPTLYIKFIWNAFYLVSLEWIMMNIHCICINMLYVLPSCRTFSIVFVHFSALST